MALGVQPQKTRTVDVEPVVGCLESIASYAQTFGEPDVRLTIRRAAIRCGGIRSCLESARLSPVPTVVTEQLHYSMLVQWSEEDQAHLVTLPEWEGRILNPVTHGSTYEDAIKHGREVLSALVASAHHHAEQLPEPQVIAHSA